LNVNDEKKKTLDLKEMKAEVVNIKA